MKKITGTREWAPHNLNCVEGCSHGCRYCYAKATTVRVRRRTAEDWCEERPHPERAQKALGRRMPTRFMFPSAHDITPGTLELSLAVLREAFARDHSILLVSKPHYECIETILRMFPKEHDRLAFRFTIGSADDSVLKFWEPHAPCFEERLDCLKMAARLGFTTSVSMEPMLDDSPDLVIEAVLPYVRETIWLGKANGLRSRLALNGHRDPETAARADELMAWQSDENVRRLHDKVGHIACIRWKDSIREVIEGDTTGKGAVDMTSTSSSSARVPPNAQGNRSGVGQEVTENDGLPQDSIPRQTERQGETMDKYVTHQASEAEQDFAKALAAAEKGDAEAQSKIGVRYANGVGVSQDFTQAEKWFRKAAAREDAVAQTNLGLMYARGDGVPRNRAEAAKLFRKAAGQGLVEAFYRLGLLYLAGAGVPQDESAAYGLLRVAADHDHAEAAYNIGMMCLHGIGVPEDKSQAAQWFGRAAALGLPDAQLVLGAKYITGEGVPEDPIQAYKWLSLAALQGKSDAAKGRDLLRRAMTPAQIAEAEKRASEFRPNPGKVVPSHPARECWGRLS